MSVRYINIKVFKTQKAIGKHCMRPDCTHDAYVSATRKSANGMVIGVRYCLEHATQGGLLPF